MVGNNREIDRLALGLLNVARPFAVAAERIDRKADNAAIPHLELAFEARGRGKFGRADRGEVGRMREQDAPAIAEIVVEGDFAVGGFRREVRGIVAKTQRHGVSSFYFG